MSTLSALLVKYGKGEVEAQEVIDAIEVPEGRENSDAHYDTTDVSGSFVKGTWDEVSSAYTVGDITLEQYGELQELFAQIH